MAAPHRGALGYEGLVYEFSLRNHPSGARRAWTWGEDDDGPVVTEDLKRVPPIDNARVAVELACARKLGEAINRDDGDLDT